MEQVKKINVAIWKFRMWLACKIIGKRTAFLYNASVSRDGCIHGFPGQNIYAESCIFRVKPDPTRRIRMRHLDNIKAKRKYHAFSFFYLALSAALIFVGANATLTSMSLVLATIFFISGDIIERIPADLQDASIYRQEENNAEVS